MTSVADKILSTTFTTAVLLTGSAQQAEAAMLRGIQSMDCDAPDKDELLRMTVMVAAAKGQHPEGRQQAADPSGALLRLPAELQDVLQLPYGLRRCFVLRLLAAMPREFCAWLLEMDVEDLDRNTYLAAQALAAVSSRRRNGSRESEPHMLQTGCSGRKAIRVARAEQRSVSG